MEALEEVAGLEVHWMGLTKIFLEMMDSGSSLTSSGKKQRWRRRVWTPSRSLHLDCAFIYVLTYFCFIFCSLYLILYLFHFMYISSVFVFYNICTVHGVDLTHISLLVIYSLYNRVCDK